MEAEILLSGNWKNVAELEENLSLDELQAMITACREKEHRHHRFMAALKGIDIDEKNTNEDFDAVQRRVDAKLRGVSEESLELEEYGLEITVED